MQRRRCGLPEIEYTEFRNAVLGQGRETMTHDVIALQTRIKLGAVVWHDAPWIAPDGTEQPQDFFGRQSEKQRIIDNLRDPNRREPVVVQGERRMGKTSMLKLISEELAHSPSDPREAEVAVLRLPDGCFISSAPDLFKYIAASYLEKYQELTGDIPNDPTLDHQGSEGLAAAIIQLMRRYPLGKRLIATIDELDQCLDVAGVPDDEKSSISAWIKLLADIDPPIRFFFTMVRQWQSLSDSNIRLLVDTAAQVELQPLAEDDGAFSEMTRALVAESLREKIDDALVEELYRESGGWPFFAKAILWHLAEYENLKGLPAAVQNAARLEVGSPVSRALEHIFKYWFNAAEQQVILHLACSPSGLPLPDSPDADGAAENLVTRGYLKRIGVEGYCFRPELIARWFRSSGLCGEN
jgi:hypothetical protein